MTDNVENHTLVLLRETREEMNEIRSSNAEIRQGLSEVLQQTALIPQMARDIAELQTGQAALSVDLKIVKKGCGRSRSAG